MTNIITCNDGNVSVLKEMKIVLENMLELGVTNENPLYVEQVFQDDTPLYYNGLGLDVRLRQDNYPAIIRIGSVHTELEPGSLTTLSASTYNTRASIGMPSTSNDLRFQKPSSSSTFYLASDSANDTLLGTGARTIFIRGLMETSTGIYEESSETIELNGLTPVATANDTWFRINLLFVLTAGSTTWNEGNIYCASSNSFTSGVSNIGTTVSAIIGPISNSHDGFGLSTHGDVSIGTFQTFIFTIGNIFTDEANTTARIIEKYTQPFNDTTYQVGFYTAGSQSYNYQGAGSYTSKTDVYLDIFDTASGNNKLNVFTYYIEFVLVDSRLINATPIGFSQT